MKLKIENQPWAEAVLDVNGFRNDLRKTLDIYSSVRNNITRIDKIKGLDLGNVINTIFNYTDWGLMLEYLQQEDRTTIRFRICRIEYKDKVQYDIGVVDDYEFHFGERRTDGSTIIVTNDLQTPNNLIDTWMAKTAPTFMFEKAEQKWMPMYGR